MMEPLPRVFDMFFFSGKMRYILRVEARFEACDDTDSGRQTKSFVIARTSLYGGSLYRGSTIQRNLVIGNKFCQSLGPSLSRGSTVLTYLPWYLASPEHSLKHHRNTWKYPRGGNPPEHLKVKKKRIIVEGLDRYLTNNVRYGKVSQKT